MSNLLLFYISSGPDPKGRSLNDILNQDNNWFEDTQDYMEWLFPIEIVDEDISNKLIESYLRFLNFLGLEIFNSEIKIGENWDTQKKNWFIFQTHNSLRITRILKSMTVNGLHNDAINFYVFLVNLVESDPKCRITQATLINWQEAVRGD